jgi:hypothetical protein
VRDKRILSEQTKLWVIEREGLCSQAEDYDLMM